MEWYPVLKALKTTKVSTKLTEYMSLNVLFSKFIDLGLLIMWQDC